MSDIDPRAALERLIRERREDYAGLSRLLGRNSAYIQQYIKRGVPKKLGKKDRELLARYFGIGEDVLGGAPSREEERDRIIPIPRLDVDASAGSGSLAEGEALRSHIGFDEKWLRQLSRSSPSRLSLIRVRGDSMAPTLNDGEDILVDPGEGTERLRDGIYVLRQDETLLVKRIAISPSSRRVTIKSDNGAYPSWPDVDLADVQIIGRVVWAGRKIS